MNPNPKFIDITFTGGRVACFVMQENGEFYSCFNLPYPSRVMSISVEITREIIAYDTEIISIQIHN